MVEQNVTVTLNEAERLELERIVIDGDEKAALAFLICAVRAKIVRLQMPARIRWERDRAA
ncbi:MAG: hypothetical protein ACUVX8_03330 [Candidatus Zipacnadales bacterium]